ncbi:MAG: glycosyltransferase family 39 protein, partial [Leptonema sp. (in: Bacteria)]|nr:glycosyltransferase family 39 protein [Leptonema sp. (in: bacteria)]
MNREKMVDMSTKKAWRRLYSKYLGFMRLLANRQSNIFAGIAIFLAGFILFLPFTDTLDLLRQGDEVMHIATVRESLDTSSWLLPQLTGQPNAYKPPLLFWLGMVGEALLGRSLLADRIFMLVLGALTGSLLFVIARRVGASFFKSILIGFSFIVSLAAFKFSRLLMMDLPMAFSLTFVGYLLLLHKLRPRYFYLWIAGFVVGVGFLFKGPLFHVYSGLLYLSFIGIRFWSPAILVNPDRQINLFKKFITEGFVLFVSSLIVPAIWVVSLYVSGHAGVLWFFFVIENVGKFGAENQPMTRIFGGWLLYLLPFTLSALWIWFKSFRQPVRNKANLFSRIFFIAAVLITLLHLLPDRKDPYYVIPVLPLVLLSVGLSVQRNDRTVWWLLKLQNLILAVLTGTVAIIFISWPVGIFIFIFFGIWFGVGVLYKNGDYDWFGQFIAASLIMILFQFLILPKVNRPAIDESIASELQNQSICLVSRNWWDVFELKMVMPNSDIVHSSPMANIHCADGHRAVLELQEQVQLPQNYILTKQWSHWSIRPFDLNIKVN